MTRWILISDLHLGNAAPRPKDHFERMQYMVDRVARDAPDFVINAGDSVHGAVIDGEAERRNVQRYWADYHRLIRPLARRCPVLSAIGNHDQTGSAYRPRVQSQCHSYDTSYAADSRVFCRQTGRAGKPPYYSTTIGGVRLVALNVAERRHHGGFAARTAQHKWLQRLLNRRRQARCTAVIGHYPIFLQPWLYDNSDSSLHYNDVTKSEGILLPMLLDAGVDLYLCGHHHIYERARYRRLTQVMAGAPEKIAFKQLLTEPPHQHCRLVDARASYVRFTLTARTIRGEAMAFNGDVIDTWVQRLSGAPD